MVKRWALTVNSSFESNINGYLLFEHSTHGYRFRFGCTAILLSFGINRVNSWGFIQIKKNDLWSPTFLFLLALRYENILYTLEKIKKKLYSSFTKSNNVCIQSVLPTVSCVTTQVVHPEFLLNFATLTPNEIFAFPAKKNLEIPAAI